MANPAYRTILSRRKFAKKDYAIGGIGLTVITFCAFALLSTSNTPPDLQLTAAAAADDLVDLTLLHNAKDKDALCLDGSLPGYHFQEGFGSGSNRWLLHIEGGGWCDSIESCSLRKTTSLGSSKYMQSPVPFAGILSKNPSQNPDFYNWNKVKIRYCDGASFAGHPENEFKNGSKLYFRGELIWEALMDQLLSAGLSNAKQALLTGCSAGGLATLIHCDNFQERLPKDATVKCLADAGFFLDEKDVLGNYTMRSFYHDVVDLQGVEKSLHKNCIGRMDSVKIQHILVPDGSDTRGYWRKCRMNLRYCNPHQLEILQGFRSSLLNALNDFQQNKEGGLFINSCFIHCQTWMAETWHSPTSPRINKKTLAESVGDWYFNRGVVKQIDCPYPCNPTCYNMKFI
ncbi:pectin acetylesterase 5 isoform X2 [Ricinus communis]|uniref:pectin acetylesterase 5 isoform X2 n=1 Tax=Ricinus communis TaxID=3988 RepID=UPI000D692041|nr:pectin acetylesterase 5 isoform X2 [Ricinus communis]|eukprot:XP_025015428.1 pectin acetylesterase 5 isoform X2 [Ricinus communis]